MKGDVLMNQKNDKEILFRGDPIVQIMATPHPGNKIIYLNEEAINEVKSFSEELSLLEVSDLVLSKLSEKPANIKFLAALERRGETYEVLPETILAYAKHGEDDYKVEGLFSKRMEYVAPESGEKIKLSMTYTNIKRKIKNN